MTPEWIRLTRLDNQAKHFQVSHIISIGPCEEGSLIRAFGAALEAVRETPDEIMALLGVDARPAAQPDKQPGQTLIIIGRETLESLAKGQTVVGGNVAMIAASDFPSGLFSSPATPSEEPQSAVPQQVIEEKMRQWAEQQLTAAAPELAGLQAQLQGVRGEPQVAGTDPPWLDEAALVARRTWSPDKGIPSLDNNYYWDDWRNIVRAVHAFIAAQPPSGGEGEGRP